MTIQYLCVIFILGFDKSRHTCTCIGGQSVQWHSDSKLNLLSRFHNCVHSCGMSGGTHIVKVYTMSFGGSGVMVAMWKKNINVHLIIWCHNLYKCTVYYYNRSLHSCILITDHKMLIIIILLVSLGLPCFIAFLCTVTTLYRYYHNYRWVVLMTLPTKFFFPAFL